MSSVNVVLPRVEHPGPALVFPQLKLTSEFVTSPSSTERGPGRHSATVLAVADLTPRMRRVTLHVPSLTALPLRPAQDVGLVFADAGGRELRRRYTIRDVDAAAGTIVLDGILHGHGPGARWFHDASVGDVVELVGPRGKVALDPASAWHLLVGDEAGLPAFAELLAAAPAGTQAVVVAEVADAADELPMPSAGVVSAHWLHRGSTSAGGVDILAKALTELPLPSGPGAAYLLGESRAMVTLRGTVQARGIAPRAVFLKGYWNLGRAMQ